MLSRRKQPRTRFRMNKPRGTLVFTNSPLISLESDFFKIVTRKCYQLWNLYGFWGPFSLKTLLEERYTTQTGMANSQARPISLPVSKVANSVCVNRLPNNGGSVQYCKRGARGNNIFAYSW